MGLTTIRDNRQILAQEDMSLKSGEILLKMRNQRGFEQRDAYAQSGPILKPFGQPRFSDRKNDRIQRAIWVRKTSF